MIARSYHRSVLIEMLCVELIRTDHTTVVIVDTKHIMWNYGKTGVDFRSDMHTYLPESKKRYE